MSDITVPPSLDEIVSLLGRYFGTTSKSAFLSHLAKGQQTTGLGTVSETSPTTLGDVILDMQNGGKFTHDIISQVAEKLSNLYNINMTTGRGSPSFQELEKMFRITYEPSEDTKRSKIVHGHTSGAKLADQGIPAADVFSIRRVLGVSDASIINKNPSTPDKLTSPGLSVVQMFPSTLTPANRDTGAISLLLNAIPTLEISRAVPFIDIVAISRTPMLSMDGDDTNTGRIMQMSLGQFLLGNDKVTGASSVMAGAVDAAVAKDPPPPLDENGDNKKEFVQMPFGTSGMEMFTSPQTLVNADEMHYEFDSIESERFNTLTGEKNSSTLHPGGRRAAPVIDRFRPLMSLVDFKVNVAPTKGTMSYKSAEMNLVLHDRSRLAEVAAFVKPDNFNRNHFLIEYGWAHPENKVHEFKPLSNGTNISALDTAAYSNLIGQFISQMRAKEKYGVVNSSFSFDDVGQVQINVKLAMLGGDDAYRAKIGQGGEIEEQVEAIRKITEAIAEVRKKISSAGQSGEGSEDIMGDGNVLNVASTTESAVNLKKEDVEKISKFLRKNSGKSSVQEIEILKESFTKLLGPNGNGKGMLKDLQNSIASEVKRKMDVIKNGYDPWLRPISLYETDINEKNIKSYVSLGKIFTVFLGMPLADTKKFDDIQIYFYAFNDKASFAKNLNIAQFPIPHNDLDTMLKEELKLEANMPILKFVNFINKAFVNDQGSPAYGMSSIYKDRSKDNKVKRDINKKFEEDGTAMFGEKQKILTKAYGPGAELLFKMPSLRIKIETVPAANKTIQSDGINEPGAEKTILRLHIFDAQTSSFTCLASLLNAAKRSQIGVITKSAGNIINKNESDTNHQEQFDQILEDAVNSGLLEPIPIDATARTSVNMKSPEEAGEGRRFYRLAGGFPSLKNFVMRSMPSVRYGSQNSGILKANVQSMQNPLLATVNMQRQGLRPGDEPQNKRDAGVPMTVQPVECSLETIGCPLWEFGQQIFIDFGTGTSVDNIYQVTGIDHMIKSGEFKTNVKMTSLLAWGVYESMVDRVMEANAVLADLESKK